MSNPIRQRSLMPRLFFVLIVAAIVTAAQLPNWLQSRAAEPVAPGSLVTGLTLTLSTPDGKTVDARNARLVSLMVPAGTPVSSMLPVGPFKAVWTGMLTSKIKDSYTFGALGRGDLVVTLNDQKVLELHGDFTGVKSKDVVVHKGKTKLTVTYTAPADGDASVRLMWAAPDKILNPISPNLFLHDPAEDVLAKHESVRVGRDILLTMRCVACHAGLTGSVAELKQDAPNLTGIGDRLNRDYVASWISNPKAIRPSATMPRVFADKSAATDGALDKRAADIAAYLCPTDPPKEAGAPDQALVGRGGRLFASLGCVGCHVAPGIEDSDPTLKRVPLKYVRAQFAPGALVAFIKQPEAHYAWSKMPDFHLTDDEAMSIAAWLVSKCPDNAVPASPGGDAVRGKALFATAGCLSCHTSQGMPAAPPAGPDLAAADWSKGCAGGGPKGVDFGFTDVQKDGLKAVAAVDWRPTLARDPGPEYVARQMGILRCYACHSIDGHDNTWSDLDDTETPAIKKDLPAPGPNEAEIKGDQSRPPLTWIGEKLRPSWTADFIAGKVDYKPRQWLFARMPSFPARAEGLAKGMALTHGCPETDEPAVAVVAATADIGRTLTSQDKFGCVKCHGEAAQAPLAPFEADAPNFAHVSGRLREDYYQRWMNNPQNFLPGTKMPSFVNADGKNAIPVFGGNAVMQFDAIWQYMQAGANIVPIQ